MNDAIYEQVEDARLVLEHLGFDAQRSNERSAMVLLALLRLRPDDDWSDATNALLGTRAIMDWIKDHHGTDYAANTRETIRRFTLHQFTDAMLWNRTQTIPNVRSTHPSGVTRSMLAR